MRTQTDAIIDFADKAIEAAVSMSPDNKRQLISLAHGRRMVVSNALWEEQLEAGIEKAFADRRYVGLATIAIATHTQVHLERLLAGEWPGNMNYLFDVAHSLANPTRNGLDDVVSTVSADGWSAFDMREDAEVPSSRVVVEIVRQFDAFLDLDPTWAEDAEDAFDQILTSDEPAWHRLPLLENVGPTLVSLGASERDTSAISDDGWSTDASISDAPAKSNVTAANDTFRMVPMNEFLARPLPARSLVFGPMLERGLVTVLGAAPGIGKSTLTAAISSSVAMGRSFAGFEVPEAGAVWHMNAEDSPAETQRRFAAFAKYNGIAPAELGNLYVLGYNQKLRLMNKLSGTPQPSDVGIALRNSLLQARPSLVVLDPLALLHDLDENSNADMSATLEFASDLAQEVHCAVLVVHHARKDSKGQNMDVLRGASAIACSARSVYTLTEGKNSSDVTLSCLKSNNHSREGQAVTFKRQSVTLDSGDDVGVLVPCTTSPAPCGAAISSS